MTRRASITFLAGLVALTLATLALAGCGSSGSNSGGASAFPKAASGGPATLGVADSGLGKILVNSKGRTLYLFKKDIGTKSMCTGACAVDWPPLVVIGKPLVGSGANASLVGTSMRSDGKRQVTYNGHPLYLYVGDHKAGDTNGQGANAYGGSWFALSAAGDQASGSGSGSGSGYGY